MRGNSNLVFETEHDRLYTAENQCRCPAENILKKYMNDPGHCNAWGLCDFLLSLSCSLKYLLFCELN